MAILNATSYPPGLVDVIPSVVYIETNDTVATVTATGYLNKRVQQGFVFQESMMALVSTKTTPNSPVVSVGWYDVSKSGENWSLIATSGQIALPDGLIFVGNAGNVASPVAMSGDATISNTGVVTIATGAITALKLAIESVTLTKLAPGIAPSHIIKFANPLTTVGGAATEVFSVVGAVAATDKAFVQITDNGTSNVTVLEAVVGTDDLTITFSADPGADTQFNYQIIRGVV